MLPSPLFPSIGSSLPALPSLPSLQPASARIGWAQSNHAGVLHCSNRAQIRFRFVRPLASSPCSRSRYTYNMHNTIPYYVIGSHAVGLCRLSVAQLLSAVKTRKELLIASMWESKKRRYASNRTHGEPSPGADVAGVSPVLGQMWQAWLHP